MHAMRIAQAIDQARGPRTQTELANAIGVSQPIVSDLIRGERLPTLEQMEAIERACERPPGFILTIAGYLQPADTLAERLALDPDIDDVGRRNVLAVYDAMVQLADQGGHGD